jgi:hypothetical protein
MYFSQSSKLSLIFAFSVLFAPISLVSIQVESKDIVLSNKQVQVIKEINNESDKNRRKIKINDIIEKYKYKDKKFAEYLDKNLIYDEIHVKKFNNDTFKSKYNTNVLNYSCWDMTSSRLYNARAGNSLFKFNLKTTACADRNKVYSGSVRGTWAEIYSLGWAYNGESPDRNWSYVNNNSTEYIGSRQGVFKLCVNTNWVCVSEYRPWIEHHMTRHGYDDYSYQGG